ncbi:MAG: hypothetical protein ACREMY_14110 [bacterium]
MSSELPSVRRYRDGLVRSVMFCPEGHGVYVETPRKGQDYPCPTCDLELARQGNEAARIAIEGFERKVKRLQAQEAMTDREAFEQGRELTNALRVLAASLESEARVCPPSRTGQADRLRILAAKARAVVER